MSIEGWLPAVRGAGAAIVLAVLVTACGEKPPPVAGPPRTLDASRIRATCPLGVENAHIQFDETATGATLLFTTTPDRLDELRRRARDAAALHGAGRGAGVGHDGWHGVGGGRHGIQPVHLPPVQTRFEEVADGARLTFTPDKMDDVDLLRNKLRARAARMMSRCD
ncbi:MAG: hypothetical protein KIT84_17730 [Labilithrix sp.]|nr:hypothetical protein [Labilithrix sp.]MCW5812874.1 hypothetical protein [Labilithrix sp.]